MNSEQLRSRQAPLKQHYRNVPAAAQVTARAEGTLEMDGIACSIRTWKGATEAGLHEGGGGNGEQACAADIMLQALVGCAGVTFASVATAMSVPIRGGRVLAEATWDARGTLGVDRTVPVGMTDLKLTFEIDSDAEPAKLARVVELAERYCVVAQTLLNPPVITVEHTII